MPRRLIPDIALVAKTAKADLVEAAKAFFAVSDAFRIGRIEERGALDHADRLL